MTAYLVLGGDALKDGLDEDPLQKDRGQTQAGEAPPAHRRGQFFLRGCHAGSHILAPLTCVTHKQDLQLFTLLVFHQLLAKPKEMFLSPLSSIMG